MATITVPVAGDEVSVTTFGAPVANQVNTNTTDIATHTTALAALQRTVWTALPLGTNFQNYAGAQPCQYRKEGDVVRLRGHVQRKTGTMVNGDSVGTLPAGFRPPFNCEFILSAGANPLAVSANADGNIVVLFPLGSYGAVQINLSFSATA